VQPGFPPHRRHGSVHFFGLSVWLAPAYLAYWLWMEIRVLTRSCINCAYYGHICAFGKGKLCSLLFAKGDSAKFAQRSVSWAAVLPDFLVFVFPVIGGIVLLVRDFSWPVLILTGALLVLSFVGNAVVRGSLACQYCRQRAIGCPATKLFAQEKQ